MMELKLDLMIDDSKHVYENMKKEKIDCILFGDKIKTWDEVFEYIKEKWDHEKFRTYIDFKLFM